MQSQSFEASKEIASKEIASKEIVSKQYGYIQAIDRQALEELARHNKVGLNILQRPGNYITRDMALVSIDENKSLDEKACAKLRAAFLLGSERTSEQDIEYSIDQLVEIAVRALSPGVNDPFTALTCIDYLGSVICRVTDREFPSAHVCDEDQNILISFKIVSFSSIVSAAFNKIRQHGSGDAAILIRMLEVLYNAIKLTKDPEQQQILLQQAEMIHRSGLANLPEQFDQNDLEERFQQITKFIEYKRKP